MFGPKKDIIITLKLLTGLDKKANISGYDHNNGLKLTVKSGTRLKKALISIEMKDMSGIAYYCAGKRIGLFTKLKDGDIVTCLRPAAGG